MRFSTAATAALTVAAPALAAAPVNELVGFGAGTTGGGSGSGVTVTSCSAFSNALKTGGVIKVSGTLDGCGILRVPKDTSIIGVGKNSGMTNGGLRLRQVSNVIIRNMNFHVAPSKGDLVALDEATKVWIDHNTFSSIGLVGGKDDYDGLLDITHASNEVTVSWNKFSDHWKASLVGHSDNNASEDTGKLKVTYHHNSFININSRVPSLRFGTGHIYSNCFTNVPTSGVNSRMGAVILAEENYFDAVKLALVTDLDSDTEGSIQSKNNVLANGSTTRITKTQGFTPSYKYTTDPAASVCGIISSSAGTGIVS